MKAAAATAGATVTTYSLVTDRKAADGEQLEEGPTDGTPAATDRKGTFYVAPSEGIEGIQRVIHDHAPNVTILLGTGLYTGSELSLRNGVRLLGVGQSATVLKLTDDADTDLVVSPDPDEKVSMRVRFEDITFDGNKQNNSSGDIVYGAFWDGRFVNCEFVNAPATAFWLAGSSDGSTDDNHFHGCRFARSDVDALRLGGNRESGAAVGVTRIDTCWFGNNAGHAVRIRGNGNIVTNSKFYANGAADVMVDRGSRNQVLNNDMSKNSPTGPCVAVRAAKGVTSSTNRVSGNTIFGGFQDAVFSHADGNAVVALQVHDNNVIARSDGEEVNRSGIRAEGEPYDACSARDNTFVGEFIEAPLRLPSSWETSGNVT